MGNYGLGRYGLGFFNVSHLTHHFFSSRQNKFHSVGLWQIKLLKDLKIILESKLEDCMKSFRIRSFSGPDFPTLGLRKLRIHTLFTQWLTCKNYRLPAMSLESFYFFLHI